MQVEGWQAAIISQRGRCQAFLCRKKENSLYTSIVVASDETSCECADAEAGRQPLGAFAPLRLRPPVSPFAAPQEPAAAAAAPSVSWAAPPASAAEPAVPPAAPGATPRARVSPSKLPTPFFAVEESLHEGEDTEDAAAAELAERGTEGGAPAAAHEATVAAEGEEGGGAPGVPGGPAAGAAPPDALRLHMPLAPLLVARESVLLGEPGLAGSVPATPAGRVLRRLTSLGSAAVTPASRATLGRDPVSGAPTEAGSARAGSPAKPLRTQRSLGVLLGIRADPGTPPPGDEEGDQGPPAPAPAPVPLRSQRSLGVLLGIRQDPGEALSDATRSAPATQAPILTLEETCSLGRGPSSAPARAPEEKDVEAGGGGAFARRRRCACSGARCTWGSPAGRPRRRRPRGCCGGWRALGAPGSGRASPAGASPGGPRAPPACSRAPCSRSALWARCSAGGRTSSRRRRATCRRGTASAQGQLSGGPP